MSPHLPRVQIAGCGTLTGLATKIVLNLAVLVQQVVAAELAVLAALLVTPKLVLLRPE